MNNQNRSIPAIPLPNPGEGGPVYPGNNAGTPVIPLPNPGEGGPVYPGNNSGTPVIPLPNPGEGGPVYPGNNAGTPVIPLPNPGEGGPVYPGNNSGIPVIPLPSPGEGGPVYPGLQRTAQSRFLNAAFGYPALRVFVNQTRIAGRLNYATYTTYNRVPAGYQTVTITGTDGYIYIQKSIPFQMNERSTIAIINTAGGLNLLQISDLCCAPIGGLSNFRVSNLAYNSGPLDVLLGDGRVVYADVRFKETTTYNRIQPGTYQFFFAETNLAPMAPWLDIETLDSAFLGTYPYPEAVATLYLKVVPNKNYTVFLLSNGLERNAIQTLVVAD